MFSTAPNDQVSMRFRSLRGDKDHGNERIFLQLTCVRVDDRSRVMAWRRGLRACSPLVRASMTDYTPVLHCSEIAAGQARTVQIGRKKIAIVQVGERLHAVDALCTHMGVPLTQGALEGQELVCPWHAARFCVVTGAKKSGRAFVTWILIQCACAKAGSRFVLRNRSPSDRPCRLRNSRRSRPVRSPAEPVAPLCYNPRVGIHPAREVNRAYGRSLRQ
jgi:nitrite reductase/ring-hydroxylating ferredoxin subunit